LSTELEHAWNEIRTALRQAVDERTYHLWLEPLCPERLDGEALVLSGPREVTAWVQERLASVLESCADAALGHDIRVELTSRSPAARRSAAPSARAPCGGEPSGLNPRYTFEGFVIGQSNRLAHAAALSVAEMPAQAYNPLFIYGPPGLGKTHLLHSIGNYVRAFGGGLTVRYTTVEAFTNAFVSALSTGEIARFKRRFRDADVLLVDDIQVLARKARTEEELFHTFNALYDSGSQLVITCDRLPADLADLEDRLRQRFASGLVTDIDRPDYATRLAILRKRAAHDDLVIDDPKALAVIASQLTASVRALEGALTRVVAYASLTGQPITEALAVEVAQRIAPRAERRSALTIVAIQDATCAHFGISREALLSRSRSERTAWPRHVAMYLTRELTDYSLPIIGREFGGRDHTTVLNACRRTSERIAADPAAYRAVEELTALVGTAPS
jgi:chromosomal replication initiator protein